MTRDPVPPERGARDGPAAPVFVYADYACPWSYIVVERLERLVAELRLALHWRPLPPDPPPAVGPGRALDARERETLGREAAAEGLPLALPEAPTDTRPAHQAAELARDLGPAPFRRLRRTLFRACLAEGRDLGERTVLLELAEEAGVDGEALTAALDDGRYQEELDRAREEATRYGISATPTLLFGRFKLVGAAPVETMREAARRAIAELA